MAGEIGTSGANANLGQGFPTHRPFEEPGGVQAPVAPPTPLSGPFKNLSEIAAQRLEWIWEGWIPRGKLTLVVGEPGVGKSLFALSIAAMVTRGRQTPGFPASDLDSDEAKADVVGADDGREGAEKGREGVGGAECVPPGTVLIFSGEDAFGDTVGPRLDAAHADLTRVFRMSAEFQSSRLAPYSRMPVSGREFESTRYFDQVDACLNAFHKHEMNVPLVIIDPVERFLNCNERGSDLSEKVTKLVQIATRWNVAIVALASSILPLSASGRTAYRNATIGNEELSRAARSVLLITRDQRHEHERLVLPVKLNLAKSQPGMRFTIENRAVVADSNPTSVTSEQYFVLVRQSRQGLAAREEISELQRVMNWLQQRLSQGAVRASLVRKEATENAITVASLRRAFRRLECQSNKAEDEQYWIWQLPEKVAPLESEVKTNVETARDAGKPASKRRGKSR